MVLVFFFFFQAEDGIRDLYVTGVQTCALPISDLWVLEHGDETGRRGMNVLCSGAERHATSTVRLTPAAKSSSSSVASSRRKLPKCRDRARCGPHQASHSSA